jgi:hypothetical protein
VNGKPYSRISFTIVNWNQFSADLFKPAPNLPPCGKNNNSARTWLAIYNSDTNAYIYGYCALDSPAGRRWAAVAETGLCGLDRPPDQHRLPIELHKRVVGRRLCQALI